MQTTPPLAKYILTGHQCLDLIEKIQRKYNPNFRRVGVANARSSQAIGDHTIILSKYHRKQHIILHECAHCIYEYAMSVMGNAKYSVLWKAEPSHGPIWLGIYTYLAQELYEIPYLQTANHALSYKLAIIPEDAAGIVMRDLDRSSASAK